VAAVFFDAGCAFNARIAIFSHAATMLGAFYRLSSMRFAAGGLLVLRRVTPLTRHHAEKREILPPVFASLVLPVFQNLPSLLARKEMAQRSIPALRKPVEQTSLMTLSI
jgi:hypothetical protein